MALDGGGQEASRRLLSTAAGTHPHAFGPREWGLFAIPPLIWGCSFLFIAEGIEAFTPAQVTALRIVFGFAALGVFSGARRRLPRTEWPRLAVLAVTWMAVPFMCFSVAEQWIDSSLAGMLNGAMPLFTALLASVLLRRRPGPRQTAGLLVGFAGVIAISWPAIVDGAESTVTGVLLVLLATACYGVAANVSVPLQQAYGSLPVIWRSQAIAIALTAPFAIAGTAPSSISWSSLLAVMALGALGTGVAFVVMGTLLGRVGATRAAVAVYFVPAVAIVVGAVFRDEPVYAISLAGVGLVVLGAALASRAEH